MRAPPAEKKSEKETAAFCISTPANMLDYCHCVRCILPLSTLLRLISGFAFCSALSPLIMYCLQLHFIVSVEESPHLHIAVIHFKHAKRFLKTFSHTFLHTYNGKKTLCLQYVIAMQMSRYEKFHARIVILSVSIVFCSKGRYY